MQIRFMIDNIVQRLKEFMENEARSCSMDFGCVTPEYVYRMWGAALHSKRLLVRCLRLNYLYTNA